MKLTPPTTEEFSPYYVEYIQRGKDRGDVIVALPMQVDELNALLGKLTDKQALFKFGPEEWSIKELVGHLNDVERVFSYRLLRISRNDQAPLTGFEQNDYVREAGFDNYELKDLLKEFELLRGANVIAINNMSEEATKRIGTASGYPVSARALIHMMVGHVDHHVACLQEKYLPALK